MDGIFRCIIDPARKNFRCRLPVSARAKLRGKTLHAPRSASIRKANRIKDELGVMAVLVTTNRVFSTR
jgi:hypothetical protein